MAEQRQSNIFYYYLIFLLMGYLLSSNVIYAANLEGIVYDSGYYGDTEIINYRELPYPEGDEICPHADDECGLTIRYCEQDLHYTYRWVKTFSPDNTYTLCDEWEFLNDVLRKVNDSCHLCEQTYPPYSWANCLTYSYSPYNPPIVFRTGEVNYTLCFVPSLEMISEAQQCGISLTQKMVGTHIDSSDSSHTFVIDCDGERVVKLLRVETNEHGVTMTSEGPISGDEFKLNGHSPSEIVPLYYYYYESSCSSAFVYTWSGKAVWEIPINKRCGDSITLTPSIATGHGSVSISDIKTISKCIFDPEN
jgi:hypothetical protein